MAFRKLIIFFSLNDPSRFEIVLRRGIVPSLCEGVAPKNAPSAEKDPQNDAEIVDAALGIFRTSGLVQTHPSGEIFLIETNAPDAKTFQNRPICLFSEVPPILLQQAPECNLQQVFPF